MSIQQQQSSQIQRGQLWRTDACGIAIIAGLTAVAYFSQIAPAIDRHEQAKAQAAQLVADQSKARELERSLIALKDHLEKSQQAAAGSQLTLEPATQLNTRLARLTDLAAHNGLQVDVIESGATRMQPRYSTIDIRIAGRGT